VEVLVMAKLQEVFRMRYLLLLVVLLAGCDPPSGKSGVQTLAEARQGYKTSLLQPGGGEDPVPAPPARVFRIVKYESPVGPLPAYLTPDPRDGKQHPAIVWITGGDCNTIGEVWQPASPDNDQTAAAYRQAGIVMMFPSLRGGNRNPGNKEGYYGEVDDVIAAAEYLATQPYVDPNRIYLGGHSSGGTMVLLVAEYDDRFRAIFSFGPVDDVSRYIPRYFPQTSNQTEIRLRSPIHWLAGVQDPTFVLEGVDGNISSLRAMAQACTNPKVHFIESAPADHFNILAPTNRLIAQKILQDTGKECNLSLTQEEVDRGIGK
jgi:dienelactone hydrolase